MSGFFIHLSFWDAQKSRCYFQMLQKMIINLNDVVLTGNVLLLNLVDVTYNVIRSGLVVNKGAGCGWEGVEIPNDSQEWDL